MYEPSGFRGLYIRLIVLELLILLCTYCGSVYICMYVPAASHIPPGVQPDFLVSVDRGQESGLEPSLLAFGLVVTPLPAATPHSSPLRRGAAGPFLDRIGRNRHLLPSELGLGCTNPVDFEVCIYA